MRPELTRMLERHAIPHALLFVGTKQAEESAYLFATEATKSDLKRVKGGNHPDVHLYHPEGKTGMHAINALRELAHEVALSAHEAPYKFFIIHEAERMLPTSSHALLKTFEEPTPRTVMILLSAHPERLLPQIRSRCHTLSFSEEQARTKTACEAHLLELLSQGNLSFSTLESLAGEVEGQKKEWEKEMRKHIPPDLLPLQREHFEKEIEGALTLKYQEHVFSLFLTVQEWYRDALALKLSVPKTFLFYPQYEESLRMVKCPPFQQLEKAISEARLAITRSIKLSSILEALFLKLHHDLMMKS